MLKNCRLYVIIDTGIAGNRDLVKIARQALLGGADIIQLRDKSSSDRRILKDAMAIKNLTKKYRRTFIMNDRVDIAFSAGADGVHVGQGDMPVREARRILGRKIIGVSTHNVKEAKDAQKNGADYIAVGPIFKTPTKNKLRPIGPAAIGRVRKAVDIPFFAIGGISQANIADIKRAGAKGMAVVSAAVKTNDVYSAVKKLKDRVAGDGGRGTEHGL